MFFYFILKKNCSDKGNCSLDFINSMCICESGWFGDDCSQKICNGNGILVEKQDKKFECECFPGFSSINCDEKDCLFNCSSNGKCNKNGVCECFSGFEGEVICFFSKKKLLFLI